MVDLRSITAALFSLLFLSGWTAAETMARQRPVAPSEQVRPVRRADRSEVEGSGRQARQRHYQTRGRW